METNYLKKKREDTPNKEKLNESNNNSNSVEVFIESHEKKGKFNLIHFNNFQDFETFCNENNNKYFYIKNKEYLQKIQIKKIENKLFKI